MSEYAHPAIPAHRLRFRDRDLSAKRLYVSHHLTPSLQNALSHGKPHNNVQNTPDRPAARQTFSRSPKCHYQDRSAQAAEKNSQHGQGNYKQTRNKPPQHIEAIRSRNMFPVHVTCHVRKNPRHPPTPLLSWHPVVQIPKRDRTVIY